MSRRGRRPKPTALHSLHGTLNSTRHKHRETEPEALGLLEEPPDFLTESQKEGWRYAIAHAPLGIVRMIDRGRARDVGRGGEPASSGAHPVGEAGCEHAAAVAHQSQGRHGDPVAVSADHESGGGRDAPPRFRAGLHAGREAAARGEDSARRAC